MANPPCLPEDSIKYYKPKYYTEKSKSFSFFASIFSLIIYISFFYIFKISLYTLLNSYIFWFLFSNNLILIIALDYGVFSSSSKQIQDSYDQYHVTSHVITNCNYQQVDDKKCIKPKQEMDGEMVHGINKYIITENTGAPDASESQVVEQNEPNGKPNEIYSNVNKYSLLLLEVDDSDKACEEKSNPALRNYGRRKFDRPRCRIKSVMNDESMQRTRSTTMKVEGKADYVNEFNSMTNEELNRRVEEFIQKINRQIRLQEVSNV